MGKNHGSSWLSAVKKAFRSPVKDDQKKSSRRREENEQEEEEKRRGKRRWIFRKPLPLESTIQHNVPKGSNSHDMACADNAVREEICATKQAKQDSSAVSRQKRDNIVARPVEIIRLTRPVSCLTRENEAALVIQAIFRGYLARRALLALQGVVKLQALIRGHNVRKRAKMTLQCIQSLVRVQAQICDQHRRLSCEATVFNQAKTHRNTTSRNASNTSINLDVSQCSLEEIQDLIDKAKDCSLRQGKTLAHAISQQMRGFNESRFSDYNQEEFEEEPRHSGRDTSHQWVRKDRNLCIQRDPIKTVEIDTTRPYSFTSPTSDKSRSQHRLHHEHEQYLDSYFMPSPLLKKHHNLSVCSPKTPSSSKIRSIQVHSSSPRCRREERNCHTAETPTLRAYYFRRMSISENSDSGTRPNYMAATASATARIRSESVPRLRPSSPNREQTGSSKKRLSFPVPDR